MRETKGAGCSCCGDCHDFLPFSCGEVYGSSASKSSQVLATVTTPTVNTRSVLIQPPGQLGMLDADEQGRASFHMVSEKVKVWDIIGRGMVVHSLASPAPSRSEPPLSFLVFLTYPGSPLTSVMCAVIARSAGLFQNTKKVCTCDGVTIWDEAKKSAQQNRHTT